MIELSIVIPAYNEGLVVKGVILDVLTQLKSLGYNNKNSELILVDDGSTDNTCAEVGDIESVVLIRRNL